MVFTQAELDYLATQRIGRLVGGGALGRSKKFRNVQRGSTVAFVVDDLATVDPWAPRGIEIRGTAVALTDQEPPLPGLSREIIRITPPRSSRGRWAGRERAVRCELPLTAACRSPSTTKRAGITGALRSRRGTVAGQEEAETSPGYIG
ncbi:hypothetical protein [Microbispora sp. NPDC046933]|uniref:hypothetical protein n=1 Tax=Microbispora sp. NPDC046933 TaxID=3155618 RepID=UPI0033E0B297